MVSRLKGYLRSKVPKLVEFKQQLDILSYETQVTWHEIKPSNASRVFRDKFIHNGWAGNDSVSGHGSDFIPTETLRQELPHLLNKLGIKSMLDAPCGDFFWMNFVSLELEEYIGIDIVSDLIESNQQKYGNASRKFINADITQDILPKTDLILCRDCLVHLSFRDIKLAVQQFKRSNSSYLLTTTYPGLLDKNSNILTGDWRPLDMEKSPFHFPNPIQILHEKSAIVSDLKEKSLGLWRLADIQIDGQEVE
jgi:hypothetical protein